MLVGTFEFEPRIRADLSRPGFLASAIEQHVTLGTDKAYDVTAFVQDLRDRTVTPHIAVNGVVSKGGVIRRCHSRPRCGGFPYEPIASPRPR